MSALPLKLIVGLGNPGSEYARTRHNAGFWMLDELARRYGATFRNEPRHQAELARARIAGEEVWLLKPMSFMNRSGGPTHSVAATPSAPSTTRRRWSTWPSPPSTRRHAWPRRSESTPRTR